MTHSGTSSSSVLLHTVHTALGRLAETFVLRHLDTCTSTNTELLEHLPADDGRIHVLVTDTQTGGKGRRGRQWLSWPEGSLTFSILWRFLPHAPVPAGLSLAAGVAVAKVMEQRNISGIQLKWPNDVMVHGKKLAGILVELVPQRGTPPAAIIGIGINLKLPDHACIPNQPAVTDLHRELGHPVDRALLLAHLLHELHHTFQRYAATGFPAVHKAWEQRNAFADLPVRISGEDQDITGICIGVDEDGALLIMPPAGGKAIRILSGEVSLRGIA